MKYLTTTLRGLWMAWHIILALAWHLWWTMLGCTGSIRVRMLTEEPFSGSYIAWGSWYRVRGDFPRAERIPSRVLWSAIHESEGIAIERVKKQMLDHAGFRRVFIQRMSDHGKWLKPTFEKLLKA